MGKRRFPAISMTQHAANSSCKWLSATGHFYALTDRRPNGSTPAALGPTRPIRSVMHVSQLGEYAWYSKNSDDSIRTSRRNEPLGPLRHARQCGGVVPRPVHSGGYRQLSMLLQKILGACDAPYPPARGGSWTTLPAKLRSPVTPRGRIRAGKSRTRNCPEHLFIRTRSPGLSHRAALKVPSAEECSKYWITVRRKE